VSSPLRREPRPAAATRFRPRPQSLRPEPDASRQERTPEPHARSKGSSTDAFSAIGNAARRSADPTGKKSPLVETHETIHPSVRRRLGHQVELRSEHGASTTITYQPANLPIA